MPLVKTTLESGIKSGLEPLIVDTTQKAFHKAMQTFNDVAKKQIGNTGVDVFSNANDAASNDFSNSMKKLAEDIAKIVSDQVDTYIKTATIITPMGQAVTGTAGSYPVVAATVTDSAQAKIS